MTGFYVFAGFAVMGLLRTHWLIEKEWAKKETGRNA